jgi:DNA-binding NarL/FixJ family response regulator
MLSSSNHRRDVTECYRMGANGYVTKPIDFRKLSATIVQVATYWLQFNQIPK